MRHVPYSSSYIYPLAGLVMAIMIVFGLVWSALFFEGAVWWILAAVAAAVVMLTGVLDCEQPPTALKSKVDQAESESESEHV